MVDNKNNISDEELLDDDPTSELPVLQLESLELDDPTSHFEALDEDTARKLALDAASDSAANLRAELAESGAQMESLQTDMDQLLSRWRDVESRLKEKERQIENLAAENEQLEISLEDERQQKLALEKHLEGSFAEINTLEQAREKDIESATQLTSELSASKDRLDTVNADLARTTQRASELEGERDAQLATIEQLRAELAKSQSEGEELERTRAALEADHSEQHALLEAALESANEDNAQLRDSLAKAELAGGEQQSELTERAAEIQSLAERLRTAEEAREQQAAAQSELEEKLRSARDEERRLNDTLAKVQAELEDGAKEQHRLERLRDSLTEDKNRLSDKLSERNQVLAEARSRLREAEQRLDQRGTELENKGAYAQALAEDANKARQDYAMLAAYVDGRQRFWSAQKDRQQRDRAQIAELTQELDQRVGRQSEADKRARILEQRIDALESQLDRQQTEVQNRRREAMEARDSANLERLRAEESEGREADALARIGHQEQSLSVFGIRLAEIDDLLGKHARSAAAAQEALREQETWSQETGAGVAQTETLIAALETSTASMETELETLRVGLAEATDALAETRSDADRKKSLLSEREQKIQTLERELAELARRDEAREAIEATNVQLEQDKRALQEELAERDEKLVAKEKVLNNLHKAQRQKESELIAIKKRLAKLGQLEASILDLDAQMSEQIAAPPRGKTRRLLIAIADDTEVRYPLYKSSMSLGRSSDNDIQVRTNYVSRYHARIVEHRDRALIEDLSSKNGIFVNGERTERQTLKDGDAVTVGETQFIFRELADSSS